MGGNTGEFAADHANGFAAWRNFPVHQFFQRQGVSDIVSERCEIIETVSVGNKLVVLHVLRDFFVATMKKPDVRGCFGDDLAIKFEDQSQHPVSGRVRWSHVEHHLFADVIARLLSLLIAHRRIGRDHASHRVRILNFARGKGHGEGVCLCSRVASRTQAQKVGASNPGPKSLWVYAKLATKTFRTSFPSKATLFDPVATCFIGKSAHVMIWGHTLQSVARNLAVYLG